MVISEYIEIRINSRTAKRYRDLGYQFEKVGDTILIKYTDLSQYSEEVITVKCDYCGAIIYRRFVDHYRTRKGNLQEGTDACKKCACIKASELYKEKTGYTNSFCNPEVKSKINEIFIEKYGVANPGGLPEITEKRKKTCKEKYGCEYPSKLSEIKEKTKKTNRDRFGADYPMQSEEFKKQTQETCLERYGTKSPFENDEIKEKIRKTVRRKYGVDYITQNPEIAHKALQSRSKHENFSCSSQQRYFYSVLGGELNYPFKNYAIDIAYPDSKIAIEYNGGGHNLSVKLGYISQSEFDRNEVFREKQLHADGWKIVTFISLKSKTLPKNEIIKCMEYANNQFQTGRHWIEFNIDDNTITTSQKTLNMKNVIGMND